MPESVRDWTRPEKAVFCLDPLVAHARVICRPPLVARRSSSNTSSTLRGTRSASRRRNETRAPEDVEIRSDVVRWLECSTTQRDTTLEVRCRAIFFGPLSAGQHDVRELGGLRGEKVDDGQEIERLQPSFDSERSWRRHDRIRRQRARRGCRRSCQSNRGVRKRTCQVQVDPRVRPARSLLRVLERRVIDPSGTLEAGRPSDHVRVRPVRCPDRSTNRTH